MTNRLLPLLLALSLQACATVMTGTTDMVEVLSEPAGASFSTNTGHEGVTPGKIEIPDSVTLEVDYALAGFEPASATLEPRTSPWVIGNILIGGLIGLAIDFISGGQRTHDKAVTATLAPIES